MSILSDILGYVGANKAAGQISQGNINAIHGILNASEAGAAGVGSAAENAPKLVNEATAKGNQTLADVAAGLKQNLDPYLSGGTAGVKNLQRLADTGFNFSLGDWQNDPGYKFQMEQGQNALQNSAAARGGVVGGNVLQDLTKFGQGLASTYYDQAFNRALKTFGANVDVNRGLTDVGQIASGQLNQTQQNAGNQIAANTVNAGYYGGNTGIDTAKFIANLKERAAEQMGPYAVASETAHAAGTLGKNNALGRGVEDLAGLITRLVPSLGASYA